MTLTCRHSAIRAAAKVMDHILVDRHTGHVLACQPHLADDLTAALVDAAFFLALRATGDFFLVDLAMGGLFLDVIKRAGQARSMGSLRRRKVANEELR